MTKSIFGLSLAAAVAVALPSIAGANAGAQLDVQPRHTGESAAFSFAFEGNFGPATHEVFGDTIAFRRDSGDSVTVTGEKSAPRTLSAKRASSGELATPKDQSQLGDIIYDYNAIVKLVAEAPKSIAAGATWTSIVPVRVSPDTWLDIPVAVRVADVKDGKIALDATGTKESTLFFKGFTFPINVTVHMTEAFGADGRLGTATFNADELAQGGAAMKISYNWKFVTR